MWRYLFNWYLICEIQGIHITAGQFVFDVCTVSYVAKKGNIAQ